MSHITLVLGKAPEDATASSHIMAGPWCLPDRVLIDAPTPDQVQARTWKVPSGFTVLDEPLGDPDKLEQAAWQARTLVLRLLPLLAQELNTRYGLNRSSRYWDVALTPWLVRVAEVLVDRLYRAQALIAHFGSLALRVPITGDLRSFSHTADFIFRGMLDPNWNRSLLSRLLERDWPETWEKVAVSRPSESETGPDGSGSPVSFWRRLALNALFSLPFPRIKGFGTMDSLRLSLALCRNRNRADGTFTPARLAELDSLNTTGTACAPPPLPLHWTDEESLALALSLLPRSLQHPPRHLEPSFFRTRIVSVAACEDDAYRLRAAAWRERGCRLAFVQHGGEYGYMRSSVAYPLVEYCQHRFITWGWTRHGSFAGHFLPLPHPQLAAIQGRHRPERDVGLLFVGTEMLLLPYTLKSMPRGQHHFSYRADKARFLSSIPRTIRSGALYRPYFDGPCALPDASWVLARFPEMRRCMGPLDPWLLRCRLLVLDHPGTTLALALAAGVPTVLFWNREMPALSPDVEPLLDGLRSVGMLHHSPEAAAAHVTAVWNDIPGWWQAQSTRSAVATWARQHALTPDLLPSTARDVPLLKLWAKALTSL